MRLELQLKRKTDPDYRPHKNHRRAALLWLFLFALVAMAIGRYLYGPGTVYAIQSKGVLRVQTFNSPTTVYEGRDGWMGFEHDLVSAFAEYIGVTPVFGFSDNVRGLLDALKRGEADMVAAGMPKTRQWSRRFLFGPAYMHVQQQLVCNANANIPRNANEMVDTNLLLINDSSSMLHLTELRRHLPQLSWDTLDDAGIEQLFERIWRRESDCTIANSNLVSINRRYYPDLRVAFSLSGKQDVGWMLGGNSNNLRAELNDWFARPETQTLIRILHERYFDHLLLFDYVDTKSFLQRVQSRLPRYEDYFREAASGTGISWQLLAAQSYQESHWNPRAKSPTGVRGIMMLTLPTAKQMGVKNRLSPKASIFGGAAYLAGLKRQVPEEVQEPDRTWFALAAYNVGMGHVLDAMNLARQQGLDPNLWPNLKQVLPLLSRKKYYRNLKHGYARGSEPVNYVQSIREYYDLLTQKAI